MSKWMRGSQALYSSSNNSLWISLSTDVINPAVGRKPCATMPTRSSGARAVAALASLALVVIVMQQSMSSLPMPADPQPAVDALEQKVTHHTEIDSRKHSFSEAEGSVSQSTSSSKSRRDVEEQRITANRPALCQQENIHNFFTELKHSFIEMVPHLDQPLQTEMFLDCCKSLADIFDRLGTAFMPVESNFQKNIRVISEGYERDKEKYSVLSAIIEEEAAKGQHKQSESVTDSILWIARSILLMTEMFKRLDVEDDFPQIVSEAYYATIRQYHNLFVRSVFSMVSTAVPSKRRVMDSLANSKAELVKPGYDECLYASAALYNQAVVQVCDNIKQLLATFDIELMHPVE